MLKCRPISSIEYLTESTRDAQTTIGYYHDSVNEPPGRWWSPTSWLVVSGARADAKAVTRLSQGRDPSSGRKIVSGNRISKRAGFDLTFSAPKSFSALWVVSQPNDRIRLNNMLYESVQKTLTDIFENGLIEARRGKNGVKRETVKGAVAALYRHTTSRDGDPQLHVHAALLMAGLRADGSIGAVNNEKILQDQMALGARFRLRLAEQLEAAGVPVVSDSEHGFRITGDNPKLLECWSKRRKTIMKTIQAQHGVETRGHAGIADQVAVATRNSKSKLPPLSELAQRWFREAEEAGYRASDKWARMDGPPIVRSNEDEQRAAKRIVTDAIVKMSETQSLFERREIEAAALTMAVGRSSIRAIRMAIDAALKGPDIVDINKDGLVTTRSIIEQEREIVQIARSRQTEPLSGFSKAATAAALDDPRFSCEQRQAIEHALSSGGIAVVEGGPGVGKTTCSTALSKACVRDKKRLILAAPSWTAVEVLKNELRCNAPHFAIDKFIHELKSGKFSLARNDLILVDEAGMCSNGQILVLMRYAAQAGAAVRLQGDTNQIASVARGDPLSLISKSVGGAEIRTIRRQKVEWMRQASMAAQKGDINRALATYADHGAITVATDGESAVEAVASAFRVAHGQATAIASRNQMVSDLNERLREDAKRLGILTGPELTIKSVPRGQKSNMKPEIRNLKIRAGDRLLLGGEMKINDILLRNATKIAVESIDRNGKIRLSLGDNRIIETSCDDIQRSGRNGGFPIIQHAYAMTAHASQGATWSRTIWLASREDSRSALVAMTRHTSKLDIVIDKCSVARSIDSTIVLDRTSMSDPSEPFDERPDHEIVATVGKGMERVSRPRNALDAIGLPAFGRTVPRRAARPSQSVPDPMTMTLLARRRRFVSAGRIPAPSYAAEALKAVAASSVDLAKGVAEKLSAPKSREHRVNQFTRSIAENTSINLLDPKDSPNVEIQNRIQIDEAENIGMNP